MNKTALGLLIMAYGTPRSLDEVEAYYTHIRHGRPPTPEALEELKQRYLAIGGLSPLNAITRRQVAGIEERVAHRLGQPVRAQMGMKHAPPFIADAAREMVADGIDCIATLVLTPQYSAMSVGAYQRAVQEGLDQATGNGSARAPRLVHVDHWHLHPGFVSAVARRLQQALERIEPELRDATLTLFTAHSLPQRLVETGDPYADHLRETAAAIASEAGIKRWDIAWQSAGRTSVPWLGPDICEVIPGLPEQGYKAVVVCPAGFVADHLEVLYDIDIEARQVAERAGLRLERSDSLNDAPDFLDALADVLVRRLAEAGVP